MNLRDLTSKHSASKKPFYFITFLIMNLTMRRRLSLPLSDLQQRGKQGKGAAGSELLDLDIQRLNPVGDLPGGHVQDAGRLGLHPTGLFQGRNHPFAL